LLLQALAEVVADVLGGPFESEEMLQELWQAASCKAKAKSKCVRSRGGQA